MGGDVGHVGVVMWECVGGDVGVWVVVGGW